MFPLPAFYYFEIGAFVISVLILYRFKYKPMSWFIPFLWLMICTELTARYIRRELHQPNTWIYNISIPIEYFFYGFIIGNLCLTPAFKKIIFIATSALACWALINICFIQGYSYLNTHTLKMGSACMIVFSCIGLLDLFHNDEHQTLLQNNLFWISAGVLFFNAGEFTYLFFFDTFIQKGWDKTAQLFAAINNKMIFILYSCISIAILCTPKQLKKT